MDLNFIILTHFFSSIIRRIGFFQTFLSIYNIIKYAIYLTKYKKVCSIVKEGQLSNIFFVRHCTEYYWMPYNNRITIDERLSQVLGYGTVFRVLDYVEIIIFNNDLCMLYVFFKLYIINIICFDLFTGCKIFNRRLCQ